MPGCSVPNCSRRANHGFRLFIFPKNPERRFIWTKLCNREDDPPPKYARICEFHFDADQFERNTDNSIGKLKLNAIPTIFDTIRKVNVTIETTSMEEILKINGVKEIDHNFDDVKPEFVDVSQHVDDPLWTNEFDVDVPEHSFEKNSSERVDHRQDFDPMKENNNCEDNREASKDIIEPELREECLKNTTDNGDIHKTVTADNNNRRTVMNRIKSLEKQLTAKDEELEETKILLSKSLKQVKRLEVLNDKFRKRILELSDQSKSECHTRFRRKVKRGKCLKC